MQWYHIERSRSFRKRNEKYDRCQEGSRALLSKKNIRECIQGHTDCFFDNDYMVYMSMMQFQWLVCEFTFLKINRERLEKFEYSTVYLHFFN